MPIATHWIITHLLETPENYSDPNVHPLAEKPIINFPISSFKLKLEATSKSYKCIYSFNILFYDLAKKEKSLQLQGIMNMRKQTTQTPYTHL